MIPKILHFVWLGDKLPDEEQKNIDSWHKHNPDLKIMLWGNDNIKELNLNEGAMKAFRAGDGIYGYQSDIIRQHAVNMFGGFYSDTDIECHKKLPEDFFKKDYVFIKPREGANWLNPAFFGSYEKSPVTNKIVSGIVEVSKEYVDERRCYIYGPTYFSRVIRLSIGMPTYSDILDIPKYLENSLVLDYTFWCNRNKDRYITHYFKASWIKRK